MEKIHVSDIRCCISGGSSLQDCRRHGETSVLVRHRAGYDSGILAFVMGLSGYWRRSWGVDGVLLAPPIVSMGRLKCLLRKAETRSFDKLSEF